MRTAKVNQAVPTERARVSANGDARGGDPAELTARRLEALQTLTVDLGGAVTTDQITDLVVSRGMMALRADRASVFLIEPGGESLVAIARRRSGEEPVSPWPRLRIDASSAVAYVARTGEPVFIENPDEYVARFGVPDASQGPADRPDAIAAVPLEVEGRRFGVLVFAWNHPHALVRGDRQEFIGAIARLAAGAIERGRLFDRERRHAAELEAVLAALGEGILVAGPDGSLRSSNAAAVRILGGPVASIGEILGRLLDTDNDRPATLPTGSAEFRLAARPRSWVEITAYQVRGTADAASPSMVIVCRDVTAFRQGQALREAFLGLLSHELRTPVTTIYGGSAVLAKPRSTLSDEARGEILADIAGEADRLYRLVEDLLVLARFDEGFELGDEPALLQHIVPAVVGQERGRWPGIVFEVSVAPDLPAVSGDDTSITQVVRNLLSNAAKYSDSGSLVTAIVEEVAEGVAVRVLDEGPGIEPTEAEAIFDPFFRSPSTAKKAGGAGIGLYVSRRLVDAMSGRIWASRRPVKGSEFSFVLPTYRTDGDD